MQASVTDDGEDAAAGQAAFVATGARSRDSCAARCRTCTGLDLYLVNLFKLGPATVP